MGEGGLGINKEVMDMGEVQDGSKADSFQDQDSFQEILSKSLPEQDDEFQDQDQDLDHDQDQDVEEEQEEEGWEDSDDEVIYCGFCEESN